jgi:hypothetical protein
MELQEDRKSQIILDLLKELMSEMKGEAGKKFKPAEAEIEISAEPVKEEDESPEDEAKEVEEDGDEEDYDGADLEDVLDKASEDEPKSAASLRLAKLAASNKK